MSSWNCLSAAGLLAAALFVAAPAPAGEDEGVSATVPAAEAPALNASTTTTTTIPINPPTTTLDTAHDVTGGGRFHGGFGTGGFDTWTFTLATPAVLDATTSNASDGCDGDTIMTLSDSLGTVASDDDSGPGHCSRITVRLETPGSYSLRVSGFSGVAVRDYWLTVDFVETECGNGKVELLEECDDGNLSDADCCLASCKAAQDDAPCDDGLLCNGDDSCSNGACLLHTLNPCPGADGDSNCAESCSDSAEGCIYADPDGSPCDNGLYCDGVDKCFDGICQVHNGNPCRGADGDGDCTESCKESSDTCTAADANDTPCDDGLFCNGSDKCSGGLCSIHSGNPCPGADGDGNCSESCNETADACTAADPNGSACNDGLFCTGTDSCSGGACSVHTGSGCPGADGDSNCAESCNEAAKNCSAADADNSACNDGLFCNGSDKCAAGACTTHAGSPCPGPDGDSNCAESCNESLDNCSAADSDGVPCNDGLFCNGADTCSAGTCSVHAGNPCPGSDGDGNCAESCNETADTCSAADPDGSACNDGSFCNGTDTCSSGACSSHAGNPCAGPDGDANCSESCNETSDTCTAADPNGSACNDGLYCNGSDSCSAGACSTHAGNPCPGADGDGNCAESCNEAADNCSSPDNDGSACNDGLFCNGADTCSAGACSLHAGNPCSGPDGDGNCSESCSESSDNCSAPDPDTSNCNDGLYCNGADSCSAGACSVHAGNPCSGPDGDGNCSESCNEAADDCTAADPNASNCNDGLYCNGADTCSAGACSVHAGNPCPGADGDGNCAESCDEAADNCAAADSNGSPCNDGLYCNGADSCSGGTCSVHAGNPCSGPDGDGNCAESCNETSDSCTAPDPDSSACSDGQFCNGADSCSSGSCTVHAGNPCSGPDGDGNCAESCNETNDSCTAPDPDTSACNDGLYCNGADSCAAGACSVHAGNPCPGADGDGNCAETCNEAADDCSAADPNASPCDDGVYCNGTDSCSNGSCSVHGGNPCPGADGDVDCSETCNEATHACTASDPDGSSCDDGLACNGTDSCIGGSCNQHSGLSCPGADGDGNCSESCSDSAGGCTGPDPNGTPCDDGIFCNGPDRCSGGSCSVHLGNPCAGPDGDANCAESCDEASDTCTASDSNGAACNDGVYCNGADSCSAGACSVHAGNPCPGSDGDGNCAESCDESADNCSAADANASACNDGVFCNGADSCSNGSCTVHAGNPCSGPDGDGNCSESCNEASDACNAADPDTSLCNDGLYCNGSDSCSGGACSVHTGTPCPGADGDGNCAESCNEAGDSCTAADANGSACDDGVFCNGADSCANGACSVHAGNPCPGSDGDANCAESCDEAMDTCTAADSNGAACNDGVFCNGADTCSSGACSVHAGNPCSGADGDGNCSESCNEASDACNAADPDTAPCDDGLFCNGGDQCSGGNCSVHAGSPCAGADGDGNCAESCNEAADTCNAADPIGSACDDGVYCNGADECAAGTCSVHAGSPCGGLNGSDADCSESCNEGTHACDAADPNGSACDDGVFCNGADSCASGVCSTHAGDPCPVGDGDSNCSQACNEAASACTLPDPLGSACSDGDACSVSDTCDGAGLCTHGDYVDCNDQDDCTVDSCTEAEPHCAHTKIPGCPFGLCGDLNGNGSVTAGDALGVLKAAVGGDECAAKFCSCDTNANGTLTASDALAVLRYAVGSLPALGCQCGG